MPKAIVTHTSPSTRGWNSLHGAFLTTSIVTEKCVGGLTNIYLWLKSESTATLKVPTELVYLKN